MREFWESDSWVDAHYSDYDKSDEDYDYDEYIENEMAERRRQYLADLELERLMGK